MRWKRVGLGRTDMYNVDEQKTRSSHRSAFPIGLQTALGAEKHIGWVTVGDSLRQFGRQNSTLLPQESHTFDMTGLREKVKAAYALNLIKTFLDDLTFIILQSAHEDSDISGLSMDVATDIADSLGGIIE